MTSSNEERVFTKVFSANYPGDRRKFDSDYWVGPNTMGEYFRPVSAEYDEKENKTRIVFDLVTKEDVKARIQSLTK